MKKLITGLTFIAIAVMSSLAAANSLQSVLVTPTTLQIPYKGSLLHNGKNKIVLGGTLLNWTQSQKDADVVATLPSGIASGSYELNVSGLKPVFIEIGSVSSIAAETTRAEGAEAGLNTAIAAANTSSANGIAAETSRAQGAEAGLNTAIAAANTSSANGIAAETSRAQGAEAGLTNLYSDLNFTITNSITNTIIYAEKTRAMAAESGLMTDIVDENYRAQLVENELQGDINNEISRAINAEQDIYNELNNKIWIEYTRANAQESGLTNSINDEVTRANTAETGLNNSINDEVTRAYTSEIGLTNAIAAANDSIMTASNNIVTSLTKTNFLGADNYGSNNVAGASAMFQYTIPVAGVYQISFYANLDNATNTQVQIIETNSAAILGYFQTATAGTFSGQMTAHCNQGDTLQLENALGSPFSYGSSTPTNAPSASFTVLQIQ
jgi:hypothetical protein